MPKFAIGDRVIMNSQVGRVEKVKKLHDDCTECGRGKKRTAYFVHFEDPNGNVTNHFSWLFAREISPAKDFTHSRPVDSPEELMDLLTPKPKPAKLHNHIRVPRVLTYEDIVGR